MNPASPIRAAQRRAALLVHAMPASDQDWLLSSLAPGQRAELDGLLHELRTLGIPRDEEVLRDVLEAPAALPDSGPQARLERLTADEVSDLAGLLRHEPASLVATLLAIRAWPWKESILDIDPVQRQRLVAARASLAPGLQQAVCEAIVARLDSARREAPTETRAAGWMTPWRALRPRWGRA